MSWETPSFSEVVMSSEIGAYQDDFEERTPVPSEDHVATTQPADSPA